MSALKLEDDFVTPLYFTLRFFSGETMFHTDNPGNYRTDVFGSALEVGAPTSKDAVRKKAL